MLASFTMAAGAHVKAGVAPGRAATAAATPAPHADGPAAGVRHGDGLAQPTDVPTAAPATAAPVESPPCAPEPLRQEDAIGAAPAPARQLTEPSGDVLAAAGGVTPASDGLASLDAFKAMLQQAAGMAELPMEHAVTHDLAAAAAEHASSAKPAGTGETVLQPRSGLGCGQLECAVPLCRSSDVLRPAGFGGASASAAAGGSSIAGDAHQHAAGISAGGASSPVGACEAADSRADVSYDGPLIFGSAAAGHDTRDAPHVLAEGVAEGSPKISVLNASDILTDEEERAHAPAPHRCRSLMTAMPPADVRHATRETECTAEHPVQEPTHAAASACETTHGRAASDEGGSTDDAALHAHGSDAAPNPRGAWRGRARAAEAVGESAASATVGDSLDVLAAPLTALAARAPAHRVGDSAPRSSTAEAQRPPDCAHAVADTDAVPSLWSAPPVAPRYFGSTAVPGATAAACVHAAPHRYPPSPAPSDDIVRCGSVETPPASARTCSGAGRSATGGRCAGSGDNARDTSSPAPDSPASGQPLWGSPDCDARQGMRGRCVRPGCSAMRLCGSPVSFAPSPLPAELTDGGELYVASRAASPQAVARRPVGSRPDLRPVLPDIHPVLQEVTVPAVDDQTQRTSHNPNAGTGANL